MSLLDSWIQLHSTAPNKPAIIYPTGDKSSRDTLNQNALSRSNKWKEEGLQPRQIVAVHTGNGLDWISSFIAALYCHAIIVPIDFNISREQALTIATKSGASLFCHGNEVVNLQSSKPRKFQRNDIVLGKLTSGSTGDPKLLFFSHSELSSDGQRIISDMGILPTDINLGVIPWGHSYGIGNLVIPFLLQGTAITWTESPLPNDIASTIETTQATVFPAVPALLKALNRSNCDLHPFKSLRLIISAGARLLPEIAQSFHQKFNLIPHNFYGSSETGGICYDADGQDSLSGRSIGKLMTNVRLTQARDGRFYISSPSVYTYKNRSKDKDGNGRLLMVDRAELTADNSVILGSRAKGFAKIGGKRIALNEIEDQLKTIEGISDALVIELSCETDSTLGAAIESKLPAEEIKKRIHATLPRRLRPQALSTYPEFPTTPRGKTNTRQLTQHLTSKQCRLTAQKK